MFEPQRGSAGHLIDVLQPKQRWSTHTIWGCVVLTLFCVWLWSSIVSVSVGGRDRGLKSCCCETESKHCWARWIPVFKCVLLYQSRGGWTGLSLLCGGYVIRESLPTAPMCFCFSQWANASLSRPHSLSSRPLSWKHSPAEATQGQACEVELGAESAVQWGGGSSRKSHDSRP